VAGVLKGPKSGRGYPLRQFVRALVWMLHAEGWRLENLRELKAEKQVLKKLGKGPPLGAGSAHALPPAIRNRTDTAQSRFLGPPQSVDLDWGVCYVNFTVHQRDDSWSV
jgi:hypothetical protein